MGNLGKRLRRELKKSPGKAALLGLVCLIAVWYWAPLVKTWFTGTPESPQNIIVVKPAQTGGNGLSLIATAEKEVSKAVSAVSSWQTLAKWLDEDPRAMPATLPEDDRDPFGRAGTSTTEEIIELIQEEAEEEEPTKLVVLPEPPVREEFRFSDLGLTLGGTIVGTRHRSATINGETYQEGAVVKIEIEPSAQGNDEADGQAIELTLTQIHPYYVVLTRQGKEHRLQIERSRLALGDRIQRRVSIEKINTMNKRENVSTGNLGVLEDVLGWFIGDM